jgi:peptide/nickel transport system permease protein
VPVWDKVTRAFPYTLSITIGAAVLWVLVGVPLGILAGLRRGRWTDKAVAAIAAVGMSIPLPIVAYGLLWVFAFKLHLLPTTAGRSKAPWDEGGPAVWTTNYLLVWVTLAVLYAAAYIRITRASIVETMGEDYIRTAKAKGLSRRAITLKHGLRPSITPIVTLFGLDLAGLIGGAILTETIFGVPGIGDLTFKAQADGDLPVILAVVLIAAFFIIIANATVDVLYAVIDPRAQLS